MKYALYISDILKICCTCFFLLCCRTATSQALNLADRLQLLPAQEKPYVHLDNNSYFLGDTIWYKAYVVDAPRLRQTDMSRVLYVELVSPDGLVVARQKKMISADGWGDGDFVLPDTLYSGYYEIRAYTRWMLNFDVTEHPYNRRDRELFYSSSMAKDFFRQYGTLWSRVVPVYERPEIDGDYADRQIIPRPRQRALKPIPKTLKVAFYPEGGHLVAGTRCRVAFEATNELGEAVSAKGIIGDMTIETDYMGRGRFFLDVPKRGHPTAKFQYLSQTFEFSLPTIEREGVSITIEDNHVMLQNSIKNIDSLHVAFLIRGSLLSMQTAVFDKHGEAIVRFDSQKWPTGVCQVAVFDEKGDILADRLIFVNNHEYEERCIRVEGLKAKYSPYENISMTLQAPSDAQLLSVSVINGLSDEPTYSTGNMLTDLLLTSDIKGYVARPDYYFESDDSIHRMRLDMLLMVQGWRRYSPLLQDGQKQQLRYQPEKSLEVSGAVYKAPAFDPIVPDELPHWREGFFGWTDNDLTDAGNIGSLMRMATSAKDYGMQGYLAQRERGRAGQPNEVETGTEQKNGQNRSDKMHERERQLGVSHHSQGHKVTLEAELYKNVAGKADITSFSLDSKDDGTFSFHLKPFYSEARLWLSAHDAKMSSEEWEQKEMKEFYNEKAWPDYYIKLDMFYPVFARKYSFYETHRPPLLTLPETDSTVYSDSTENDISLREVSVKARRRRGKRTISWDKPTCTYDTDRLYNLATDYGLSYGKVNFRRLPYQLSVLLFGNYGTERQFNVEARLDGFMFYRSFNNGEGKNITPMNRSNYSVYKDLLLRRQLNVRFYTDFNLRDEDRWMEMAADAADVTIDFETIPNDGVRRTLRDRSVIIPGFAEPDDFYHPDYSNRPLPDQKDYRRTLYWNPNLVLDADGKATISFWNNSSETTLKVSAAGVGKEGPVAGW